MSNSGFCIGDSNSNDSYIRWDKDGTLNIKGSIYKIIQEGILPGYGHIKVGIDFASAINISINGTHWTDASDVSKKEAQLIIDALKSEAGELTTADFHPDKVEEILKRVQIESSPDSP